MEKRHQISDYNAVISDPITVYQSPADMKQAWGYYQFPCLYRTATGEILAGWSYSEDTVLGEGRSAAAIKNAVSSDGGKTWTPVTDAEAASYRIIYNDAPTKDGKYFVSFGGADGARIPACQVTATPYASATATFWYGSRQNRVYLASDIAQLTLTDTDGNAVTNFQEPNTVTMNEYDPTTEKITSRAVTVNWRHMPVGATVDGDNLIMTPPSRAWRINSSHGVVAKDGVLYYVLYFCGFDSFKPDIAQAASEGSIYGNVYVFHSVDGGDTWNYLSQISASDIPNFAPGLNVEGACEPTMGLMPDGTFVILFRSGDNNMPSYLSYSSDDCKTWSTPVVFDSLGVLPQLVTLDCGVSIASYGRPGVFVKTTSDPTGRGGWKERVEIPLSPKSPTSNEARLSCCYTQILPISAASALLIYTDFHHPVGDGTFTKAILVREIRIEPK